MPLSNPPSPPPPFLHRYTSKVTPVLGRLTLPALLFTVVVLFTAQSRSMVHKAADVAYTALPLLIYFFVMFVLSFRLAQVPPTTTHEAMASLADT